MEKFYLPIPKHRRHFDRDGEVVNITLLWAELEYDVKYAIWKRGQASGLKGEELKVFSLTDKDTDWMLRSFQTSVDLIKERLSAYNTEESLMPCDELLDVPKEFNFHLRFDAEWIGSPRGLMNRMHKFLVDTALSEWMDNTGAKDAEKFEKKAADGLRAIFYEANDADLHEVPIYKL